MAKSVFCFSNDGALKREYPSITTAALSLGVNESSVRRAARDSGKCAGFYWSFSRSLSLRGEIKPSNERSTLSSIKLQPSTKTLLNELKSANGNILVIGDLHEPFTHPKYFDFIKRTRDRFGCKTIVQIGDLVDMYSTSRHDHDPQGMSAGWELDAALNKMQKWYKEFPEVFVTFGNHDTRIYKAAFKAGLPASWIRSYNELLETPDGWHFSERWVIDDVIFEHGNGTSGDMAAMNAARESRQSFVLGHSHSFAGVRYLASRKDTIFGMNVGCGVDEDTYALAYAAYQNRRPVISCGVILDYGQQALVIKM